MIRILIAAILVGALMVSAWFLRNRFWQDPSPNFDGEQKVETADANCRHAVNALGYLLPRDGVISVSATPGDQLAVLKVKAGNKVKKGDLLAELESKDLRFLEWEARKTMRTEAEAQLAAEKAAAEKKYAAAKIAHEKIALQEIEETAQQAQIEFLEMNLQLATRNLERLESVSESLVSVQKREQQQLLVDKSAAELNAARLTLKRMIASRKYAEKAGQAELAVAEAGLQQVNAADKSASLDVAERISHLQYRHTLVEAPDAGSILKTFVAPGESLGAQPILQMANLNRMICQAEVFETDIQCVQKGMDVRVTSPAFPHPYSTKGIAGTVNRISRIVAAPKLQSLDPYAAADRHVVEVEIEFDQAASQIAADFVNLQVQVEFLVDADQ